MVDPLFSHRVEVYQRPISTAGKIDLYHNKIQFKSYVESIGLPSLQHTNLNLVLYHARLVFPWPNCSLLLCEEKRKISVRVGGVSLVKLKNELEECGFEVKVIESWFSLGGHQTGSKAE